MSCAALAAVVALAPSPGAARLHTALRRAHRENRARTSSPRPSARFGIVGPGPTGARPSTRLGLDPTRAGPSARPGAAGPDSTRPGSSGRPPNAAVPGASRGLAAALAGIAAFWLLGGVGGLIAGAGATIASWYGLGRLEPAARKRDRERVVAMLPLAADLMTAALSAGCPPAVAAETVGTAIGGPLGRALVDAAAAASVGVEPGRAWSDLAAEPAVRPLARALTAAMTRGTSPSPVLERVSADARDAARWAGEARARSLGARAAAPLGLCFLPAFVLVGVVPIVATSGPLLL